MAAPNLDEQESASDEANQNHKEEYQGNEEQMEEEEEGDGSEETFARPFTCQRCSTKFEHKAQLFEHFNIEHLKLRTFTCKHCLSKFFSKTSFDLHCGTCLTVAKGTDRNTKFCKVCNKKFSTPWHLKRHMYMVHPGQTQFEGYNHQKKNWTPGMCELCGKELRNLQVHINTVHLGLKPHKCETCGQSFASSTVLKSHVNAVHLELKPFKCPHCGQAFVRNSFLTGHIKRYCTVLRAAAKEKKLKNQELKEMRS